MSYAHRCNLHAIAISLLALLGRVTGVNSIMEYCEKIIESRMEEAAYLLPALQDPERNLEKFSLELPHLMIDKVCFKLYIIIVSTCTSRMKLILIYE